MQFKAPEFEFEPSEFELEPLEFEFEPEKFELEPLQFEFWAGNYNSGCLKSESRRKWRRVGCLTASRRRCSGGSVEAVDYPSCPPANASTGFT